MELVNKTNTELVEKIKSRTAEIGVIGLGYVGLPLAMEFCRAEFSVTGFDVDIEKVAKLSRGESYIRHIPGVEINEQSEYFTATTDFSMIAGMDCIIICVPTPLNKHREPDMKYVFKTAETVGEYLLKDQLLVLESTTYPGTTDESVRPILESGGLRAGEDFFLAFSPEREDPNGSGYSTATIPKVVGGYTAECLEAALTLYDQIVEETVPVSSTRVAESAKLLENIYRAVNIAMVNELKVLFDRMDIDIWEVIEAAKTKPFGFQAFSPGPGLGGHCIPIDPFYLTWKAREYDISTRFIELAGEINSNMPYFVIQKTIDALNENGQAINGARILILGLAYKKDIDDLRESPALKIIELLEQKGALVDYNDPLIETTPKTRKYAYDKKSIPLTSASLSGYDCVVLVTDHSAYDPDFITENARLVVDTRNYLRGTANANKVRRA